MTLLVADIGGTNSRIGLFEGGAISQLNRFENDAHASFDAILDLYVADKTSLDLEGCCIAVAGPVTSKQARLTNRDWVFDCDRIGAALPGNPQVKLANDLVALGYALPRLTPEQQKTILPGVSGPFNAQSLVAGMGTGFNVCMLRGGVVFEAELGHASLPASVVSSLREELGREPTEFSSNEALFSGRGMTRFHKALTGQDMSPAELISAYDSGVCDGVEMSVAALARAMGLFARELVFQYLPFGGIHFAGSAARGLLNSGAIFEFKTAFQSEGYFSDHLSQVPIHVITDDLAALTGAAHFFKEE